MAIINEAGMDAKTSLALVPKLVNELHDELHSLRIAMNDLENKLQIVLDPSKEVNEVEQFVGEIESKGKKLLVDELSSIKNKVETERSRLRNLMSRLHI